MKVSVPGPSPAYDEKSILRLMAGTRHIKVKPQTCISEIVVTRCFVKLRVLPRA